MTPGPVRVVASRPDDDAVSCSVCGRETCEDATHAIRLAAQHADAVMAERPPETIVEGVAYADRVTVLAAESGAGKTFALLDIAASVSAGIAWHGRHTRGGSVLYVSFEGDALGYRLRALREAKGHRLQHLYVLRASDPLSPTTSRDHGEVPSSGELYVAGSTTALREHLAASGQPALALLVIDTVRASLAGSEDSSEHVSGYLRAVRRLLARAPGAAVILAHHAGWQDGESQKRRERGSSAWRGNSDVTVYLEAGDYDAERAEARLTLRALKLRDSERPAPLHLLRRRVELCEAAGDELRRGPATSCVIEPDRRSREDLAAEARQATSAADITVLRAMRDRPEATGISKLRGCVGMKTQAVSDAVGRILRAGWATEGGRGKPYVITEAGHEALEHNTQKEQQA